MLCRDKLRSPLCSMPDSSRHGPPPCALGADGVLILFDPRSKLIVMAARLGRVVARRLGPSLQSPKKSPHRYSRILTASSPHHTSFAHPPLPRIPPHRPTSSILPSHPGVIPTATRRRPLLFFATCTCTAAGARIP